LGIGIAGLDPGAGLYVDFETRFCQRRENCRHKRNPPIPRINFFRHTDDHENPACIAIPCIAIEKIRSRPVRIKPALAGNLQEPRILVERMGACKWLRS
jgi:hypothetical protein